MIKSQFSVVKPAVGKKKVEAKVQIHGPAQLTEEAVENLQKMIAEESDDEDEEDEITLDERLQSRDRWYGVLQD